MIQCFEEFRHDFHTKNANENWVYFRNSLRRAIETTVPKKRVLINYDKPWMNSSIRSLIKRKRRKYKVAKKSGHWDKYNELSESVTGEMAKAQADYLNNLPLLLKNNPKTFWKYAKGVSKTEEKLSVLTSENREISDPK